MSDIDLHRTRRRKMPAIDPAKLDRLPPHSPEAEQGVLGCLLWSPRDCGIECAMKFRGDSEWFYDLRHQTIYDVMQGLLDEEGRFDLITLQQRLKDKQILEQVGGIAYLSSMQDAVPSAANLSYYLDIVVEKAVLRKLIRTCSDVVGRAYEHEGEGMALVDEAERCILAVRPMMRSRNTVDIAQIQRDLISLYDSAMTGVVAGLLTDYPDLDRKLGGALPQEVIVIGGTPSSGKTTLALNIVFGMAERGNIVSIKTLETSASKVVHRFQCMAGRVSSGGFLRGQVSEDDMRGMMLGVDRVKNQRERLMIDDNAMTDAELLASCRRDYQAGARVFLIDMLQNIMAKGEKEYDVVTAASRCCARIAKELNVPVFVTSALNRLDTDKDGTVRRPTMHDLRQSGQIESDATKILLLHSPKRDGDLRDVTGIVVKNKDGPLGDVPFTFFADQFRFETAARPVEDEPPRRGRAPHAD